MERKQIAPWMLVWQISGLVFLVLSWIIKTHWSLYTACALLVSGFVVRTYQLRHDRKAFRENILWLIAALAAGVLAYIYCAKQG